MKFLVPDLDTQDIINDFKISRKTLFRALSEDGSFCLELKYSPGVKRKRITDEQIEAAENFLDENFPVTSGRDYRVIKLTNDNLYVIYYFYCLEREMIPMGKTYFMYNFLKQHLIRHSKDETVCPYCQKLKILQSRGVLDNFETIERNSLEKHVERFHKQIEYYLKTKRDLINNKEEGTVIVIQDFTQIKVQETFFQDLIICFYLYDANEDDKLKRVYRHFIAPNSRVKNDCLFVFGVWKQMVQSGVFNGYNKVTVFSDGGPKHFKMTGTMTFFAFLKNRLNLDLTYHFFLSPITAIVFVMEQRPKPRKS